MTALTKGWMDDTRRGPVWAVGGYVGGEHRWEYFDNYWPIALANHDLPYFHMKEMRDPNGIFGKWCPPEDHREELANFFLVASRRSLGREPINLPGGRLARVRYAPIATKFRSAAQ